MHYDLIWYDDIDAEELKAERLAERRYSERLSAHPNCQDPDHPGCEKCEDEGETD